jgi:hypothetical protein
LHLLIASLLRSLRLGSEVGYASLWSFATLSRLLIVALLLGLTAKTPAFSLVLLSRMEVHLTSLSLRLFLLIVAILLRSTVVVARSLLLLTIVVALVVVVALRAIVVVSRLVGLKFGVRRRGFGLFTAVVFVLVLMLLVALLLFGRLVPVTSLLLVALVASLVA